MATPSEVVDAVLPVFVIVDPSVVCILVDDPKDTVEAEVEVTELVDILEIVDADVPKELVEGVPPPVVDPMVDVPEETVLPVETVDPDEVDCGVLVD